MSITKTCQQSHNVNGVMFVTPIFFFCQALHRACTLPFRDLRSIVNDMKKKKLVQEVLQDIGKTNVAW